MRATSAQDHFVPAMERAYEAMRIAGHHGGAADALCDGCCHAVEGAMASVFRAWEVFLFRITADLMAGGRTNQHHVHNCLPLAGARHPSIAAAETALLRTRFNGVVASVQTNPARYLLLHSASKTRAINDYWLENSPVSQVMGLNGVDVDRLMVLRHGLSHGTADAQTQLRALMLHFEPFLAFSSPGEFLLTIASGGGGTYFDQFAERIYSLAVAISP